MVKNILTDNDREMIRQAIEQAEKTTRGEIYAVLAGKSSDYFYPASLMWTVLVFVLSILMAFFLHYSWYDVPLHYFGLGMAGCFLIGLAYLKMVPVLCRLLTPRKIKNAICQRNAWRQFLSHNVHRTEGRTGILLFVSLEERYAEVIADAGLYDKVDHDYWNGLVAILTQNAKSGALAKGYLEAITEAGCLLAKHFPPAILNKNELPDHLVEI